MTMIRKCTAIRVSMALMCRASLQQTSLRNCLMTYSCVWVILSRRCRLNTSLKQARTATNPSISVTISPISNKSLCARRWKGRRSSMASLWCLLTTETVSALLTKTVWTKQTTAWNRQFSAREITSSRLVRITIRWWTYSRRTMLPTAEWLFSE